MFTSKNTLLSFVRFINTCAKSKSNMKYCKMIFQIMEFCLLYITSKNTIWQQYNNSNLTISGLGRKKKSY